MFLKDNSLSIKNNFICHQKFIYKEYTKTRTKNVTRKPERNHEVYMNWLPLQNVDFVHGLIEL